MLLVWDDFGQPEAWAKTSHLYGKATGNSLGGPKSWVGLSQGIIWVGQTVWARLIERHTWHPLASSVCVCGDGSGKKLWPVPDPSSHPDTRQFNSSPYISGAFQSAAPHWSSEGVSLKSVRGPFNRNCLRLRRFLSSTASIPTGFTARSYGYLSSWQCNPGLGRLVWGRDPLLLRYPSWFLSDICGYVQTHSVSQPPLPVSMWFLL